MRLPGVLVVGRSNASDLGDLIFDMGLAPVFCKSILSAIGALRRERFQALVVDGQTTDVDVLELILNVRDVDARIDILVVDEQEMDAVGMQPQPGVHVVDRARLTGRLQAMVDAGIVPDGPAG